LQEVANSALKQRLNDQIKFSPRHQTAAAKKLVAGGAQRAQQAPARGMFYTLHLPPLYSQQRQLARIHHSLIHLAACALTRTHPPLAAHRLLHTHISQALNAHQKCFSSVRLTLALRQAAQVGLLEVSSSMMMPYLNNG